MKTEMKTHQKISKKTETKVLSENSLLHYYKIGNVLNHYYINVVTIYKIPYYKMTTLLQKPLFCSNVVM